MLGYVQDGRFNPLLVVESAQFGPYDPRQTRLVGIARNAFEANGAEFPIQKEVATVDARAEPVRYGLAPGHSYENTFFELDRGAKPRPASAPSVELRQNFLRFLAPEESEYGDLQILYATDLDRDEKTEP